MWDYDIARSNDLIGEVTFELPHLDSLVGYKGADGRSTDRIQLPSKVLMRAGHTQAGSGKDVGGRELVGQLPAGQPFQGLAVREQGSYGLVDVKLL